MSEIDFNDVRPWLEQDNVERLLVKSIKAQLAVEAAVKKVGHLIVIALIIENRGVITSWLDEVAASVRVCMADPTALIAYFTPADRWGVLHLTLLLLSAWGAYGMIEGWWGLQKLKARARSA
jgi:hypothetical protein